MTDYESLVQAHHAMVYRIALGILRDSSSAEDVAQDVFLHVLEHPDAWAAARDVRAYFGRAAVNGALKAIRSRGRREARELAVSKGGTPMDPVEVAFRNEVRAQLAALPEEERLAVDLHYVQGLSLASTAEAMALAPRTVSDRIAEGLKRLRRALGVAAFAGLLAGLESELSQAGAAVPEGLRGRLLGLRARVPAPRRTAAKRGLAGAAAVGLFVLLGSMAWRAFREEAVHGNLPVAPAGGSAAVARGGVEVGDASGSGGSAGSGSAAPVAGGVELEVVARRPDGEPHRQARVTVRVVERERKGRVLGEGVTDARGRCVLRDMPARAEAVAVVRTGRGASIESGFHFPVAGRLEVDVVFRLFRMSGRVTDAETGEPIAGASVFRTREAENAAKTDADGRYEFLSPESFGAPMFAFAEGYLCESSWSYRPDDSTGAAEHDFGLHRGIGVRGRIVDAAGAPVAGATIDCWSESRMGQERPPERSDGEGRFRFTGLVTGALHSLQVRSPGLATTVVDFRPAGETDLGDIGIEAPGRIRGRVVDAEGAPVAGFAVRCQGRAPRRLGAEVRGTGPIVFRAFSQTDALGRFEFDLLASGEFAIAFLSGSVPQAETSVRLEPGERRDDVELRLPPGRRLRVRARDRRDGAVAGVRIFCEGAAERLLSSTDGAGDALFYATDPAPTLRVAEDRPGESFRGEGLAWKRGLIVPAPLAVPAGATDVTLVFGEAGRIRGRVLDPDGRPMAGARIHATLSTGATDVAFTDKDGRFQLAVPAEATVDLALTGSIAQNAYKREALRVPEGELRGVVSGNGEVVFAARWAALQRLTIRVCNEAGHGVAGALVTPHCLEMRGEDASTGDDGLVALELPDRPLVLSVRMPGQHGESPLLPCSIADVRPDGQTLNVCLRAGLCVSGRVVGPESCVLEDAFVQVFFAENEDSIAGVSCGPDGSFRLYVDPAGPGSLILWGEARAASDGRRLQGRTEGVRAPADAVTVLLAPIQR